MASAEIEAERPLEDYGMNSVSAVALMREVHRRFGIAAPVNLVYAAGSLTALAARLETQFASPSPPESGIGRILRRADSTVYEPLVQIKSGSGSI